MLRMCYSHLQSQFDFFRVTNVMRYTYLRMQKDVCHISRANASQLQHSTPFSAWSAAFSLQRIVSCVMQTNTACALNVHTATRDTGLDPNVQMSLPKVTLQRDISADSCRCVQATAAQSCPYAQLAKERRVVEQISQRADRQRLIQAGLAVPCDRQYGYPNLHKLVPAALDESDDTEVQYNSLLRV